VFSGLISDFKDRIDTAMRSATCGAVAAVAGAVAVVFLCIAGFVWVEQYYGTIIAALAFAAVFVLVAVAAIIAGAVLRHGREERRRVAATQMRAQPWLDPSLMTTGLQIGRALGARRLASLAVLGAALTAVMMLRPTAESPPPAE
jgi:hypothetical protein